MKKLIREIRSQPLHVRHVFMWTSVVIAFSVVGYAWFEDTRKEFVALLHQSGAPAEDQRALAQSTPEPASPLATLKDSFSDLGANISKLFLGEDSVIEYESQETTTIPPQKLP